MRGGTGRDRLYGGRGNDRLYGSSGNDRLHGHSGRDRLVGGRGIDRLHGDRGNDSISSRDKRRRDLVVGGSGRIEQGSTKAIAYARSSASLELEEIGTVDPNNRQGLGSNGGIESPDLR